MADPGRDDDVIGLDLHPPAAAVTELATGHVTVDRLAIQLQTGGQALQDAHEPAGRGTHPRW